MRRFNIGSFLKECPLVKRVCLLVFTGFISGVVFPSLAKSQISAASSTYDANGDIAATDPSKDSKLTSGAFQKLEDFRKELHEWDRSVRGFRVGHNFFGSYASSTGNWQINGTLVEGDYKYSYDHKVETTADFWSFQYTFHLPLEGSVGYYLGSSAGVILDEDSLDRSIVIERTIVYPGFAIGLVWNFSAALRGLIGLDSQLVRYERFRENHQDQTFPKTATFFNAYNVGMQVGLDFFFRLRWGLRVMAENTRTENLRVERSGGSLLGISRQKETRRLFAGIVYHLI